jgi:hypothetical protein
MITWGQFEAAHPALAAFGAERLGRPPAYLGTVRSDGGPRVHPVTPVVGSGHLFVFMEPASPKGRDLRERASTRCTARFPTPTEPAASST